MVAATSNAPPADSSEPLDLAELGKSWTPPPQQQQDTSAEVSDIIATLPWWAARGLLYIVVGFTLAAIVWSAVSRVDTVVATRGTLVPEGNVQPVQSAGAGVVQLVSVREGDAVTRGQRLIQLDATELRTRLGKLREELMTSQTQLRQLRATGSIASGLEQENRISRLQGEIAGAELAFKQTTITAPLDGIITTLDVRSTGAVTQAGERIATISPTGARLVIEVRVPNKDIAFIEKDLPVKLMFDAFPYQDYGTIDGRVIEVSPDAIADESLGSIYKVVVLPERNHIVVRGKAMPLRPGLALTAEIITERKSVLSMLFDPFSKLEG